jgi:hypothetical protein
VRETLGAVAITALIILALRWTIVWRSPPFYDALEAVLGSDLSGTF